MTIAIWVLSVLLIAEFVIAPVNLWTGRTMPTFTAFTGYSRNAARRILAPVKLGVRCSACGARRAVLVAAGLAARPTGIIGAAIITAVCAVYLTRLAVPGRATGPALPDWRSSAPAPSPC